MKKREYQKQQAGVSLIELLIGIFIIVVVLMGIAALITRSIQINQASDKREKAIFLAKKAIEEIRKERDINIWEDFINKYIIDGSVCLSSENCLCFFEESSGDIYTISKTIELIDNNEDNLCDFEDNQIQVSVTVSWQDFNNSIQKVEQKTLLTNWNK
ncbi:hypothetical protein GYA19_00085 [Candidatus Beckwithbacteria bacterium]|nr:hypothetical protein [Candidatus Beckwithbacteria bacterium]